MAQRETCGQRKSVKKYLRAEPRRYLGPTPLFKTEATAGNSAATPSSLLDTVFYSAHSEQCSVCPSDSDSASVRYCVQAVCSHWHTDGYRMLATAPTTLPVASSLHESSTYTDDSSHRHSTTHSTHIASTGSPANHRANSLMTSLPLQPMKTTLRDDVTHLESCRGRYYGPGNQH